MKITRMLLLLASAFAFPLGNAVSSPLSNAHVYPVPFVPSKGHTQISFTGLPGSATVHIFSVRGEFIRTLHEDDGDGQLNWDARSTNGSEVSSGVYIYFIESPADQISGKLVVVR